jgi:hypothetical protein
MSILSEPWPNGPVCPHCGGTVVGGKTARPGLACIRATVGTAFEQSKIRWRICQQKITIFFSEFFRKGERETGPFIQGEAPGLGLARPPARLESSALAGGWNRIASSAPHRHQ